MKVLVATGATQGTKRTDFNGCVEGEFVWMLDPCPRSEREPDGPCGCGRAFSGMSSHRQTTTALVRDVDWLTREKYTEALRACFDAHGWCSCCTRHSIEGMIDELLVFGSVIPVGTVIERRLGALSPRRHPPAKRGRASDRHA